MSGLEALRGQTVAVFGAARSGVAAANLLQRAGAVVCLSDPKSEASLADQLAGLEPGVRVVTGRNDLAGASLVVVSPGIPPAAPIWRELAEQRVAVWSEIELGYRAARAPLVAITGTDGKTTTTTLVGAIFAAAGRPHAVLGNIGRPLCDGVEQVPADGVLVVEVSCFQLLHVVAFRPKVALLLNLAEDHLDYHPTFEHYVAAKLRVFAGQGAGDTAVLSADDAGVRAQVHGLPGGVRRWEFSGERGVEAGVGTEDGVLWARRPGGAPTRLLSRTDSPLLGRHNGENLAAAAAAALALDVEPAVVARALTEFRSLPHRLEPVAEVGGVRWINDSKATSPHAALAGLRAIPGPVVLLAGGTDKGLDLAEWAEEIARRCPQVVLTGPLAPRLAALLGQLRVRDGGGPTLHLPQSFPEAVAACRAVARAGDTVLLGPGCSSYDSFRNYEERGELFRRLAQDPAR